MVLELSDTPRYCLTYGDLRATLGDEPLSPGAVAEAVMRIRCSKLPDPATLPNAGSFFKNPIVSTDVLDRLLGEHPQLVHYPQEDGRGKLAAGWLVDRAGWRGRREGGVGVHDRQALVLVHHGGATGRDLLAFAARIQADIQEKFGVSLELEPRVC